MKTQYLTQHDLAHPLGFDQLVLGLNNGLLLGSIHIWSDRGME